MFTFIHRRQTTLLIFTFIACLLICSLFLHGNIASAAPATGPSITLAKTFGPPTTNLKVTGMGFGASETVVITFDANQVGTATTDSNGSFSTKITVPASALPGHHTVKATGNTSHLSAHATFVVRTNWAMSGFDPQGDNANPYENVLNTSNVSNLTQNWVQQFSSPSGNTPIVYNGILYEGANEFSALNASTGTPLWTYPISTDVAAAAANDIVYVSSDQLYALHAKTGKLIWSAQTGSIYSSPIVVNNIVYVGSWDNSALYAFNATTGALIWTASTGSPVFGNPIVTNGVVYILGKYLYAFDAKTGSQLWKNSLTSGYGTTLAAENGILYTNVSNGTLSALNGITGKTIWTTSINEGQLNDVAPAIANGVVYVAANYLYAFNAQTGIQVWSTSLNDNPGCPPTVANGVVYLSETYDGFFTFNAATGKYIGSGGVGNNISNASIVVVNGYVYSTYLSSDENSSGLYAYHLPPST